MKIYTVMQAAHKVSNDADATVFLRVQFEPETHIDEADAVETAQRLARQHPGLSVWIVEGEAVSSYRCGPLPVIKDVPTVQCLA